MRQNNKKYIRIIGWLMLLLAIGFVCLQVGYVLVHERYQVEYIDNRLFYIINMFCVISLCGSILLLIKLTNRWKVLLASVVGVFIIGNGVLWIASNKEVRNIISISPDFKNVFSIKENVDTGEATYFRSYYTILARPKAALPHNTVEDYNIDWLANDVVVFTYQTAEHTTQQFIGTYGDRDDGLSYYYVGAQIHGVWEAENVVLTIGPEGITITENNQSESFDWDHVEQFGTLAIVLSKDNEATWTIALNEDFKVDENSTQPPNGTISLYKAAMENKQSFTLHYTSTNEGS